MPATSTSAAGDLGLGVYGTPSSGPCSPPQHCRGVQHCTCMGTLQHHLRHTWATCAWTYTGLLSQSEMLGHRHGHVCPWHHCTHSVTHTVAWAGGCHRHTHAQPGVHMQHHSRCKGSTATAPANQLWHATPTWHTPTQTAFFLFPNSQRCRQTARLAPLHLLQTPTHCCLCPEGMGCEESTHLCLPPSVP